MHLSGFHAPGGAVYQNALSPISDISLKYSAMAVSNCNGGSPRRAFHEGPPSPFAAAAGVYPSPLLDRHLFPATAGGGPCSRLFVDDLPSEPATPQYLHQQQQRGSFFQTLPQPPGRLQPAAEGVWQGDESGDADKENFVPPPEEGDEELTPAAATASPLSPFSCGLERKRPPPSPVAATAGHSPCGGIPSASNSGNRRKPPHVQPTPERCSIKRRANGETVSAPQFGLLSQSSSAMPIRRNSCVKDRPSPSAKHHRPSPLDDAALIRGKEKRVEEGSPRQRGISLSDFGPAHHICKLPLTDASTDLNYVSPDTIAALLRGDPRYGDCYDEVRICGRTRQGSHAYDKHTGSGEAVHYTSLSPWERGPTLCRFLRTWDRKVHEDSYPELYYPELYILEGGYKRFFHSYPELCEPQGYVPMLDRRFTQEMKCGMRTARQNKTKGMTRSRSWTTESPIPALLFTSDVPTESELFGLARLTNSNDDLSVLSISPKRGWSKGALKRSASAIIFPNLPEQTHTKEPKEAGRCFSARLPRHKASNPCVLREDFMAVDNPFADYSASSSSGEDDDDSSFVLS